MESLENPRGTHDKVIQLNYRPGPANTCLSSKGVWQAEQKASAPPFLSFPDGSERQSQALAGSGNEGTRRTEASPWGQDRRPKSYRTRRRPNVLISKSRVLQTYYKLLFPRRHQNCPEVSMNTYGKKRKLHPLTGTTREKNVNT